MELNPFKVARLGPKSIQDLTNHLERLIAGKLWAKIIISLILGIAVGVVIGPEAGLVSSSLSHSIGSWLALPGQLFLALIQLVVIPLVFSSVVCGITSGESMKQLRSLGLRIGVYYILTTVVAISIGLMVGSFIQPGKYMDKQAITQLMPDQGVKVNVDQTVAVPKITELIPTLLPENPFSVMAGGQMIQVVLLALFFGIALMALTDSDAKPLLDLLQSTQKLSMIVIGWAMRIAPLAVFGLIAHLVSQVGWEAMTGLSIYIATVVVGLLVMVIFYLILIFLFTRRGPFDFLGKVREVQLLAFSTSSSAAVMPLTMRTAEEKLNISPAVSQFTIPLGTTINMDGTALYQGVATLFLAQVFGIDLSFSQLLLVVVTATMASIGAPGAPGVGIAVLSMILSNVGIPPSGIVLIVGVDRILDMCRTVVNVTGDLTAALVMDSFKMVAKPLPKG